MSLVTTQTSSGQKILYTGNSRNSTVFALGNLNEDPSENEFCDSGLRLFTFMNQLKQNEKALQECDKSKKTKATSFRRISNKCLKREQPGLISLIEESRKKREDFLKLVLNEPSIFQQKNRQCKTPTNLKYSGNTLCPKNLLKKSLTPRVSVNCKDSLGFGPSTSRNKLQKPKLPLRELDKNLQIQKEQRKTKKKVEIVQKRQSIVQEQSQTSEQSILIKKKRQLEQQLIKINETLLLNKNVKKIGMKKRK